MKKLLHQYVENYLRAIKSPELCNQAEWCKKYLITCIAEILETLQPINQLEYE